MARTDHVPVVIRGKASPQRIRRGVTGDGTRCASFWLYAPALRIKVNIYGADAVSDVIHAVKRAGPGADVVVMGELMNRIQRTNGRERYLVELRAERVKQLDDTEQG